MKILIVDDDEFTLCLLGNTLTEYGYEVITAQNGREAWEILEDSDIQFLITDWSMPDLTGLELCEKIRAENFPAYIYVIILTSHVDKHEEVAGLSAGADDYIKKPFNPMELKARVQIGERILSLETQGVTIFALAKLAESRDPETGMHLERMRNYTKILAMELKKKEKYKDDISHSFIHLLYLTSPLHDIGKVGIPDNVLLKPGKLTFEEFEIMKKHSLIGMETLSAALEKFPGIHFLEMARDIAGYHHEKYNGTGYPEGLKGDKIPLVARISALADVYDALTSERVYKKAFDHAKAKSIILESKGSHFDPDIVEAFLNTESSFLKIREELQENNIALVLK